MYIHIHVRKNLKLQTGYVVSFFTFTTPPSPSWFPHLVSEQLYAVVDVAYHYEVLEGHCSMDVEVSVNESHTHKVLVVLEVPHEYLEG